MFAARRPGGGVAAWCALEGGGFSYHWWTGECDGVGETAHNHLSSLRLELTRQRGEGAGSIRTLLGFSPPADGAPCVHHVVPHALGQLFVALYGEVEAVVGEEGHVDLPVLLRHGDGRRLVAVLIIARIPRGDGAVPAGGGGRRASGRAGG